MVNVKKRKGRVVIDSDSEDSASDDNLDQVGAGCYFRRGVAFNRVLRCKHLQRRLADANPTALASVTLGHRDKSICCLFKNKTHLPVFLGRRTLLQSIAFSQNPPLRCAHIEVACAAIQR